MQLWNHTNIGTLFQDKNHIFEQKSECDSEITCHHDPLNINGLSTFYYNDLDAKKKGLVKMKL